MKRQRITSISMDHFRDHNDTDDTSVKSSYVGRLAPTPSGYLHIGHAQTFWIAQQRSRTYSDGTGSLILRIEDLDGPRCKHHYLTDMLDDMTWFGFMWTHGPIRNTDCEGDSTDDDHLSKKSKMNSSTITTNNSSLVELVQFRSFHGVDLTPFARIYEQSRRMPLYHAAWRRLVQMRLIYPSPHSRKGYSHSHSRSHSPKYHLAGSNTHSTTHMYLTRCGSSLVCASRRGRRGRSAVPNHPTTYLHATTTTTATARLQ